MLLLVWNFTFGILFTLVYLGGILALLGISLISIPFGIVHVLQAVSFARNGTRPRTQFLVRLLNPSFAFLTIAILPYFLPLGMLGISGK